MQGQLFAGMAKKIVLHEPYWQGFAKSTVYSVLGSRNPALRDPVHAYTSRQVPSHAGMGLVACFVHTKKQCHTFLKT